MCPLLRTLDRWRFVPSGSLVPLAEQYGIDVIVSGHTHEYERGELNDVNYVITGQGSWLELRANRSSMNGTT